MTEHQPQRTGSELDLTICDREPIHIPDAIQPHGVLLALQEPGLAVVAASDNLVACCGIEAATAIGGPLAALLDPVSFDQVALMLGRPEITGTNPFPLRFRGGTAEDAVWYGLLHRHGGLAILEAEAAGGLPSETMPEGLFAALSGAISRLQDCLDSVALWSQAVREVRAITGFDRVKLYRFHPDWSGEVVAEDRAEHMPAYLGLHFPPSDIPVQARELYRLNPDRIIPDAAYGPVALLRAPALGGQPVDLTHAQLRSVSPVHVSYLANMGVGAAMSISVLRGGQLWGLIACHHGTAHRVSPVRRQACRLLAQVLAWQLAVAEDVAVARHSAEVRALQARILEETARGRDHRDAILQHAAAMLGLMQASGFAMVTPDEVTRIGDTPADAELHALARWLIARDDASIFETDRLATLHPPAGVYARVASGVLAVPLSRPPRQFLLWFRPEVVQTVTWGGDPNKPVRMAAGEPARLTPRHSFAAWRETVRGRSRPWQLHEATAASELRDLVLEVLVRRAEELERINAQLARSNEELEAFTYIASHDIREPLRQIETLASMLEGALDETAPARPRMSRWVTGIEASSRRLRILIDDLTEFSRLGRTAQPFGPASLAGVLDEAKADLAQTIAEAGATVVVDGTLPVAQCDRGQIRQVLQNLLSNAVKYRHPDRPPEVRLTAVAVPAEAGDPRRPMLRIAVRDNGIGFDPRHAERIFEPFQRLHGADHYPGSGIGLAICRKIVERHGGTIAVEGRPGEGATFWFTLPAAAPGSAT